MTWSPENDPTDLPESSMVTSDKTSPWTSTRRRDQPSIPGWSSCSTTSQPARRPSRVPRLPPDRSTTSPWAPRPLGDQAGHPRLANTWRPRPGGEPEESPQVPWVGSSGNSSARRRWSPLKAPTPGTYVIRVINFAWLTPTYTAVAAGYDATEELTLAGRGLHAHPREERPGAPDGARRGRSRAAAQGRPAGILPEGCRRWNR